MAEGEGKQAAGEQETRKPWTLREFGGKTVWDWLHLISALAVPIVLAFVGLWFTSQQDARQQQVEEQRADDVALQAYLDQMSTLLIRRDLRLSTEDNATEDSKEARILARARTLTVLGRLDATRRAQVLQFLDEAELIASVNGKTPIVMLSDADLSGTDLSEANLRGADLSGADLSYAGLPVADLSDADLSDADLSDADLSDADLSGTDLSEANLRRADLRRADLILSHLQVANLSYADLTSANLSGTDLGSADLSYANLSNAVLLEADLSGTDLGSADLSYADLSLTDLSYADLSEANLSATYEELEQQAAALKGATMPNGQPYEDWRTSKGRGDGGENSTPSSKSILLEQILERTSEKAD
jgi:uncharacterized protein YjbI with pentapeptide repeats